MGDVNTNPRLDFASYSTPYDEVCQVFTSIGTLRRFEWFLRMKYEWKLPGQ